MMSRSQKWDLLSSTTFDVAIIGGGINGACVYYKLCSEGYRVLLIDKGDFSSATSQASAMMAWGGLLYLDSFDFSTVWQLSRSRDRLIRDNSSSVSATRFRYVSNQSKKSVLAALYFYWLLGLARRRMPFQENNFSESAFLRDKFSRDSLVYEEACVQPSDARFVLRWILGYQNEFHVPLNYCEAQSCVFDSLERVWKLEIKNAFTGQVVTGSAKTVINAAGVWTEELNRRAGIDTPYKHIFGKGVFLAFERFQGHELPLILDAGERTQSLCLIPWGPVSLWGPTETQLDSLDSAFHVDPEEVRFLLQRLNHHLKTAVNASSIVSLRCGVRPLAVHKSYSGCGRTLEISRRHRVFADPAYPWISLYGGKITSCIALAEETMQQLQMRIKPSCDKIEPESEPDEMCCTLEDYLRRRTNISQWTPRGGLGFRNQHRSELFSMAMEIHQDSDRAEQDLLRYEAKIKKEFDDVIQEVA